MRRAGRLTALLLLAGPLAAGCAEGLRYVDPRQASDPGWTRLPPRGVAAAAAPVPAPPFAAASYAVLPTRRDPSVGDRLPALFDELLLTAVQDVTRAKVIGQADIDALIGFDRQRSLAGCDDGACFAELGGALGVEALIAFQVARVDEEWLVTGKLVDLRRTEVVARASAFVAGDAGALAKRLPMLVGKLFGG